MNSKIPLLEFCEKKQDYEIVELNYPACITVYCDGVLHCYVEKIDQEPMIASDGTVYVRSIKEYHELNRQNINTNQSNNQIIKNETRNVSHQKNTRSIKNYKKSTALAYKKKSSSVNNSVNLASVARARFGQVCRFKCFLKMNRNFILNLVGKYSRMTAEFKKCYSFRLMYVPRREKKQKVIWFRYIPFKNRTFKVCKSCFDKIFVNDKRTKINPSKVFNHQ